MTHINIKISKAVATAEKDGIITTGMVGVPVSFMFDSWWDGLIVTAVFKGSGAPISVPLLGATDTVVPWEVLKRPSTLLRIGAEGRLPDGTLVIPTTWATVGIVMSGANATDDLAKPPTPTAFDRIMSQIGNMNDLTTEAKDSLVAAINEAMTKGVALKALIDAITVPDKLPNPNALTFTGAVTGSYDGSEAKTINIPSGGGVQSDWNQNDNTQPDYVKNRPFYNETKTVTVETEEGAELDNFLVFAVGDTVTVNVDGVEHSLVAYDDDGYVTIGDTTDSITSGEGQLGWQIYVGDGTVRFYAKEAHTVSYSVEEAVKIDEKYLPPISKQVVYDSINAVFKESNTTYYFVDPTTLTDILKSINTGSPMPYIGLKLINPSSRPAFIVNAYIDFGWGTSMNAKAVDVLGTNARTVFHVYIFDTFQHAKEYYER